MSNTKEKILVVEDERIIACDIKKCLENSGYSVPAITAYGEQAIEKVAELNPDLVLMDVMLKGKMNGIEAAEKIISFFNIPVVYLTAYSDEHTRHKAKITQPFGYVLKPFEASQLITTIEIAISNHHKELIMREALEKEKELRELKNRFVSVLSHEFRNPLSTIFASTELLTNHGHHLSEIKKSEYLHHIQNAAKHLNQLLSDILLIEKSELGQFKFCPTPIDLEKFCQALVSEVELNAKDTHQVIFNMQGQYKYDENLKSSKNTSLLATTTLLPCLDEKFLRHILTNLLGNAVKYSPQGGKVRFDLFCLQGEVVFRIQDEGIGIPEADQENLFTSFHRATNVGKIPGNGLGLSIVKQYVELHGGEITFASKPGVGTTFIVSLPFRYG
jgi:signal transduction histidine kinase